VDDAFAALRQHLQEHLDTETEDELAPVLSKTVG
jgi:hypothetical protein